MRIRSLLILILFVAATLGFADAANRDERGNTVTRLRIIETTPNAGVVRHVNEAFLSARFLRMKFIYDGDTDAPADRSAESFWGYSVTYNCVGTCAAIAIELNRRMTEGLLVDGACPQPKSAVLELLDEKQEPIETFGISATGSCFSVKEKFYVLPKGSPLVLSSHHDANLKRMFLLH